MKIALTPVNALNAVGIGVAVYLLVVLGQTVRHNYELNQQVSALKAEITNLNDQKTELGYNLQYYATDSFKEREGRAKLGLQLPGENVLILPQVTNTPSPQPTVDQPTQKKRSNFHQWIDFLSGKS